MATINELVSGYLSRIKAASDKESELQKIVSEINGLIYEESKQPLSLQDKLNIIEKLKNHFLEIQSRNFSRTLDSSTIQKSGRIYEATDNSEIIKIITTIETKMKGK